MFALPVNFDQQRRKFFGGRERHRLVVHQQTAAPAGLNFAPQDDLAFGLTAHAIVLEPLEPRRRHANCHLCAQFRRRPRPETPP